MSVVFLVLPLALLVALAAVVAFTWAARRGQFDDLTTPAIRMLHDDEAPRRGRDAGEAGARRGAGDGGRGGTEERPRGGA